MLISADQSYDVNCNNNTFNASDIHVDGNENAMNASETATYSAISHMMFTEIVTLQMLQMES
jgi:hypothetical protein